MRGTPRFEEILADPGIDVVNIATPSGKHSDMTCQALRAGKHVICEKPPDVTVAKVDAMIAAQRETGKKLQIIFQSRFEPLNRRLKQVIEADGLDKDRWPARQLAGLIDSWKNRGLTPAKVPPGEAYGFGAGKGSALYWSTPML